jgi:hypothetical protein
MKYLRTGKNIRNDVEQVRILSPRPSSTGALHQANKTVSGSSGALQANHPCFIASTPGSTML